MADESMSAKQVAMALKTNPRTLRKFLREHLAKDAQPGQGGRYLFRAEDLPRLRQAFEAWSQPAPTQLPEGFGVVDSET